MLIHFSFIADQPQAQGGWFYPASGKSHVASSIDDPHSVENQNLADFLSTQVRYLEITYLHIFPPELKYYQYHPISFADMDETGGGHKD